MARRRRTLRRHRRQDDPTLDRAVELYARWGRCALHALDRELELGARPAEELAELAEVRAKIAAEVEHLAAVAGAIRG